MSVAVAERVRAIRPYRPGRAPAVGPGGKLSANEAPLGPSPAVRQAIAAAADDVHRYATQEPLRHALAAHAGVGAERVVATSGSDELCYLVATLVLEPGAPVVLGRPCYAIDALVAQLHDATLCTVELRADGAHDLAAMAAAARGTGTAAALVWLPSPHNPTGAALDPAELDAFLAAVPDTTLVVLDEAYRDFTTPSARPDVGRLLRTHDNLLVQRTLSKAHGLAGLRVGYGLGHPDLIAAMDAIRPPFNVNTVALAAARAALADTAWADYGVRLVTRERERLERFLREHDIEHLASQANFVSVRPSDPAALHTALAARGVAVRDGADLGMDGWVRITIGAPPRMALVREALQEAATA